MNDLAVARDQQLRVGKPSRRDIPVAKKRIDRGKACRIKAMPFGIAEDRAGHRACLMMYHTPGSNIVHAIALSAA
jgi:hypothetical protein